MTILKEGHFGFLPWSDGLSHQHDYDHNRWYKMTVYIPCTAHNKLQYDDAPPSVEHILWTRVQCR